MPCVLEPSWVGMRVTVRRAVGRDAGGRPQFSDIVGDLVELDSSTAVIERRGSRVEVPLALIAAARPVPPSTADELAVEEVAAQNLNPAETYSLGGWLLRADSGFTRRANSVLPLRASGMSLPETLGRAHGWYARRGLPLLVQVPVESRRLLDAELGDRGWPAEARTHLLTGRLDMLRAAPSVAPVVLAEQPDEAWLRMYRDGSGRPEAARALITRHFHAIYASVRIDGSVVAVGRGAVNEGWLGIMAVEVAPEHRRQGLAAAVMAELWRWGGAAGAARSYLQVTTDNDPAIRLYEKLGYRVHHDYHYRREP